MWRPDVLLELPMACRPDVLLTLPLACRPDVHLKLPLACRPGSAGALKGGEGCSKRAAAQQAAAGKSEGEKVASTITSTVENSSRWRTFPRRRRTPSFTQTTFGQTRQDMAALRAGLTETAWVEKQLA